MRLKWFGVLVLILALALTVPRKYVGASLIGDGVIVGVLAFGLILVIADCRADDKKYLKSIEKREQGGSNG